MAAKQAHHISQAAPQMSYVTSCFPIWNLSLRSPRRVCLYKLISVGNGGATGLQTEDTSSFSCLSIVAFLSKRKGSTSGSMSWSFSGIHDNYLSCDGDKNNGINIKKTVQYCIFFLNVIFTLLFTYSFGGGGGCLFCTDDLTFGEVGQYWITFLDKMSAMSMNKLKLVHTC